MIFKAPLLLLFSFTFINNVDSATRPIDCSGQRWMTRREDDWMCNMETNEIICGTVITDCSEGTMVGQESGGSWGYYNHKDEESGVEWDQAVGDGWDCRCYQN